ncbi:MAG: glycosyltransferase family 4 protein [Treponema sp.]|nr:glycosyltransferase family 4 protein [Treponema sp.]
MKKLFLVINVDKFFLSHRKDIALAAKNIGYDVTVITHFTGQQDEISALGLRIIDLPENPTGMNPLEEIKTFLFLKKLYSHEKPDIIHHVGIKPMLWGTLAATFTKNHNVVNAVSGTGFLFSPEKRNSKVSCAVRWLLKKVNRSSYRYIFQNNDDRYEFENAGISKEHQAIMIKGSGVDLQKFAFVPEEEKDNSVIKIVFIGRMIEAKGVLVLIESAQKLRREYEGKIQFLLCGDLDANPTALKKEELEALCDGKYIKWLGFQKNIYSVLRQCHIMCFPSFYMEGLPKSVIDAEASGLPIITTDWVGCRDTVENGYNGFVIPPKDAENLADKIKKLVDDIELRRKMGKNARLYAEKYFSIDNVVKKHLDIYTGFASI